MKSILIAGTTMTLLVCGPVYAQNTTDDTKDNKIICKRIEVSGSRLGGAKSCKTMKEWREYRQTLRLAIEEQRDRRGTLQMGSDGSQFDPPGEK